ncbi:MAG TPA: AAA family ATPase [Geobacteraceae bacterium]|nr:AAA family ATPase [Geobacteraceae bacterium]
MLTRLKVSGFKNLVDVDVRFGPFTCIAGANGAGKSNLFDAISFLSALAEKPLIDAAKSVRGEEGRASDIRGLFHRVGEKCAREMTFEAEMIVPERGVDDLGQEARAKITFLRYLVRIGFRADSLHKAGGLELLQEELSHINLGTASRNILFPHKVGAWRHSAVRGRRSGGAFISTEGEGKARIIELHTDGDGGGRPRLILAENLTRTVLSTVNAAENPTALMAKRELQSWRVLRLDPAALRRPDDITAPARLGPDGSHLAATLHHLPKTAKYTGSPSLDPLTALDAATMLYARLSRRMREFVGDVREIAVDHDEKREILTVNCTAYDGTTHPARALSDGVLRFLALAVLELDTENPGAICLEEPENGIHPESIPAMLSLLQDIAVDVEKPVGADNPLRQVIINTHSPAVVAQILGESLLVADLAEMIAGGTKFRAARFCALPDTWRQNAEEKPATVSLEKLASYLPPGEDREEETVHGDRDRKKEPAEQRKRPDQHPLLPFLIVSE